MRYLSVDIETTGLDVEKCQIIEFAAVIDDTLHPEVNIESLPSFSTLVYQPHITGEPFALQMNASILKEIANLKESDRVYPSQVGLKLYYFLQANNIDNKKVVAAGKNFSGFDKQFLIRLINFNEHIQFGHRTIDPGMFYWQKEDAKLPSMDECLKRAGLTGSVKHRALDDARDVIRLVRKRFE